MKFKKVLLIVLILCVGFIGNVKEITACGPGQTTSTHYGIWINGCEYAVTMCYLCGMHSTSQVELISYWKVDPNCPQTWSDKRVLDSVFAKAYSWHFIKQYICVELLEPPCEGVGNGIDLIYRKPTCLQKWRNSFTNEVRYIQCISGTNYCVETWRYCWQNGERVENFLYSYLEGSDTGCPAETEIPDDPPIGQWPFSDCFKNITGCN